ncbi:MAG TPA: type II secretion system protein GspG [Thiolapillus brandeum]|uniref:Type II secretion system core protein G n=1 Tax=Thiolapillus brandeum TaxID=1076588 RepID=A0A831K3G5_9GAMM|nr:type II secretion system protein GspG [Thiolapillus brandeum]
MKIKTSGNHAGFTLLELLVVLAILAMLAGLVGPRIMNQFGKGKQDAAVAQIGNLKSALELYKLDAMNYPQSLEALTQGVNGNKPILDKLPKDPWGNDYHYRFPGEHGDYDIVSYGADGSPGGEGESRDITSWE